MKRTCLFAHYDAQGEIKRHILHYLSALREICERIVFVSTSELTPVELGKTAPYCADAFTRENVGADFMMWKDAIARIDTTACDELVLANSSVFGPLSPLQPIFDEMAPRADVWGMNDSLEIAWHLQSYFIVFGRNALQSPSFAQFWNSVLPYRDKPQLIRSYEIGLARWFSECGLRVSAYVPFESLPPEPARARWFSFSQPAKKPLRTRNPSVAYPTILLRAGLPFIKAQVLRENPFDLPLDPVLGAMRECGFDMSLVEFDRPVTR